VEGAGVKPEEIAEMLMRQHGLSRADYADRPAVVDGALKMELDGLPTLTFFVELAEALGIALTSIRVEAEDHGGGCDTCGDGGGVSYDITAPLQRRNEP
jgi:hypothetical protein